MSKTPDRIDLLELDIDVRIAELWREAHPSTKWDIAVVATFMRAAYAKGYMDALTEDAPGTLLRDNGYRFPLRKSSSKGAS